MGARTMCARMAFDESGREMLREIVTAQPHATLDEVTAEFTRRTELTVNAATVRKALRQAGLRQERGAVVVKRRSQEDEAAKQRYGYTDEHRRQEPDQRYPSCLTQTEWELVADLFEQSGKRGRPPQYSRWDSGVFWCSGLALGPAASAMTKYEFARVLEQQAAQIIELDVGQCGGITKAKKIASIAEAHYAVIAPHMYCGPVAAAAAIQIDTCSPNFLIQETNQGPLHKKIFKQPLVFEDGFIVPPTGTGLGVEFDDDVLRAHLVE